MTRVLCFHNWFEMCVRSFWTAEDGDDQNAIRALRYYFAQLMNTVSFERC